MNRNHVNPIEEIFPESLFRHRLFQILIGCRYNPYIRMHGLYAADPLKIAFLNDLRP